MSGESYHEFVVTAADAGGRLDSFLAKQRQIGSRSRATALIEDGVVLVDGAARLKSHLVSDGEVVQVALGEVSTARLEPEDIEVRVPFEDQYLIVADKPAGMAVHPSPGHEKGTLVHALLGHGLEGGESFRPGVVHRLDKDTSGLLVVAKTVEVHRRLVEMLREQGGEDIRVFGGGIIPEEDIPGLKEKGVLAVFGPGTVVKDIVDFIESAR